MDLDSNKIYADVCPIQLPEAEENTLREKLKEHAYSHIFNIDFVENREDGNITLSRDHVVINLNEANDLHDRHIRIAFLLMFSSILGSYRKYYSEESLDRVEFLAEQPKAKQVQGLKITYSAK